MRSALSVALVLLGFGAIGCSSSESPALTAAGSYSLAKVNGTILPAVTLQNSAITLEITGGELTLNSNGTFTETRTGRATAAGGTPSTITSTQAGTWEESQGNIAFVALGSDGKTIATFSGTWSLEHIVYTSSGTTFEYTMVERG